MPSSKNISQSALAPTFNAALSELNWFAEYAPHLNFTKALEQAEADSAVVLTEVPREASKCPASA